MLNYEIEEKIGKDRFRFVVKQKFGLMDRNKNVLFKAVLSDLQDFSEGLSAACLNGKYGYLDMVGQWLVRPSFTDADEFSEGMGLVCKGGKKKNWKVEGGKWGWIDRQGKWVIPPFYDDAQRFQNGAHGCAAWVRKGKYWGLINTKHEWILPPVYDESDARIWSDNPDEELKRRRAAWELRKGRRETMAKSISGRPDPQSLGWDEKVLRHLEVLAPGKVRLIKPIADLVTETTPPAALFAPCKISSETLMAAKNELPKDFQAAFTEHDGQEGLAVLKSADFMELFRFTGLTDRDIPDLAPIFANWRKICEFEILEIKPDGFELFFTKLPQDLIGFVKKSQKSLDMEPSDQPPAATAKQIAKTMRYFCWWD